MKYNTKNGLHVLVPYDGEALRVWLTIRIGPGACRRKTKRMLRVAIYKALGCRVTSRYIETLIRVSCTYPKPTNAPDFSQQALDKFCLDMQEKEDA